MFALLVFLHYCLCCAAQQPETEGAGIPVTAEEMSELMYKPLLGEWGKRSRDEECERIIAGISQLITVGASTSLTSVQPHASHMLWGISTDLSLHLFHRNHSALLWSC